jgi:chromate transporter
VAIVANATVSFGTTYLKKRRDIIIAIVAAIMFGLGVNPIVVILLAALFGLVLYNRQTLPQQTVHSEGKSCFTRPVLLILSAATMGFVVLFFVHRRLFDLAILMFRIDLFAFGGGFASVPLMFHEIVEVRSWMDGRTFLNGMALGQATPGSIVITAAFIGYLLYGPVGGVIATISVFLPSFLIVIGIAPYFDRLRTSLDFNKAIDGILCSFVGLLLSVTLRFALNIPWDFPRIIFTGVAFVALLFKVDILWVVLIGTVISVVVF